MSFERPKFENYPPQESVEEEKKSEKEIAWLNKLKETEETADALGYEIEGQVKETVVAFNLMGLSTSASCEGHTDHGISTPWIEVAAANQPEERFIGEKEIFQKVADKYRIPVEDVKKGIHKEAWTEALKESSQNEETPEYRKWREENKKLIRKTSGLLQEFYQGREVTPSIQLKVSEGGEGEFRVHNGGKDYRPVPEKLTEKQREELAKRLIKYQEEMKRFTEFLKNKYFREG